MSVAGTPAEMGQQKDGDGESESSLPMIKRLDFEHIAVLSNSERSMRAQAQQIRRDLERCKEEMTHPTELLESLKVTTADYVNVNTSKLWEKYLSSKKELLEVEAENLQLKSHLTSEIEPIQGIESELHALETQLSDLQAMTAKEDGEIKDLIDAFTQEIENFPKLIVSAMNHFEEYDIKMHMESPESLADNMDETSPRADSDEERKTLELSIVTGSVQNEILQLESKISRDEEYYNRILSLHNTYNKLDLLRKVQSFFCDWTVAQIENDTATFALTKPASKQKNFVGNKRQTPLKEVVYKLHVKVHPKTLAVETAKLEPKNEALLDEVLKELALRRTMHSIEVSEEPHNDLEFLLRRIGQRILSSKRSDR